LLRSRAARGLRSPACLPRAPPRRSSGRKNRTGFPRRRSPAMRGAFIPTRCRVLVARKRGLRFASSSFLHVSRHDRPKILQIWWHLAFLDRHQVAVSAHHVYLLADDDKPIAFRAIDLRPYWPGIRISTILLIYRPGADQCMIKHRDLILE